MLTMSLLFLGNGCDENIDIPIEGEISASDVPLDANFIETQVVAAYSMLDGFRPGTNNAAASAPSNWSYGEVASDNAYKGSEPNDGASINFIEFYTTNTNNDYLEGKWRAVYEGVSRTNVALRSIISGRESGELSEEEANIAEGEMRFLRAHYHFEAKQVFNKIPYVTEEVTESITNEGVDSWARIEEDLEQAILYLPEEQARGDGATIWTARAYLAKVHMFQSDFDAARPLLDMVINSGVYSLNNRYRDNFDLATEDSPEAVFSVEYSVGDTPQDRNGNWGDILSGYNVGPVQTCCGFFQPSQNLVNAFKTDNNGLPLLDSFNDSDVDYNGLEYIGYNGTVDPRLDWTVARRGIPFLGYGIFPGIEWIRDPNNGGPYGPKKFIFSAEERNSAQTTVAWAGLVNAIDRHIIRYSQVLLWRAEVAAQQGDLSTALELVNRIRNRAALSINQVRLDNGVPAANYRINPYPTFTDANMALKAVKFETRLELAMEGQRFFDLVRWGDAERVLNAYIEEERTKRPHLENVGTFTMQNRYHPIPQAIIDLSGGLITQNN